MTTSYSLRPVYLSAMGMIAPGFSGKQQLEAVLSGKVQWRAEEMEKLVPGCLPANERRRTTALIKLAIQVALETLHNKTDLKSPATVFASSDGDFSIVDKICRALCETEKNVSPTQFHNSVHNAPAGYWAIATGCHLPSTSISAGDASFAAGLLEAMTQVHASQQPVLYVAYDYPAPSPLDEKRHFEFPFGVALLLTAEKQVDSQATFGAVNIGTDSISRCAAEELAGLQAGNPVASALPLLETVCRGLSGRVYLPYYDQQTLGIEVSL